VAVAVTAVMQQPGQGLPEEIPLLQLLPEQLLQASVSGHSHRGELVLRPRIQELVAAVVHLSQA
jgi:hypothetical protein